MGEIQDHVKLGPDRPAGEGGWRTTRWFLVVVFLMATASLLVFVQAVSGIFAKKFVDLKLSSTEGAITRALIPMDYRSHRFLASARVFEDGEALPYSRKSVKRIKDGPGRYRVRDKYVYFSSSDLTDPMENGRSYTLELGRPVPPQVLWGCFALTVGVSLFLPRRRGRAEGWRWKGRTTGAWAVFGLGLVLGFYVLSSDRGFSDGSYMANGIPISDAQGWSELSISLKEGKGFQGGFRAHRPMYPLYLASVYALFGGHFDVAQASNVFLFAMSAAFGWLIGWRFGGVLGGPVIASWLLLNPELHDMLHRTMTENLGVALMVPAVYFLLRGIGDGRRSGLFVGSLFFSFSNLARTYALPALGGLALLVLLIEACRGRNHLWRGWVNAGIVMLGGILVFFPWCLRQKIEFDIWSPSFNSGVMLYAAAEDGMGQTEAYNEQHEFEADAAGVPRDDFGERNRYFNKRLKETVAADPWKYAGMMGSFFGGYFKYLAFNTPFEKAWIVLCIGGLVVAGRFFGGGPVWLLVALPLGCLILELGLPALVLLTLGCSLLAGLLDRWDRGVELVVILVIVVSAAAFSALVGNFAAERGAPLVSWLAHFLVCALPLIFLVRDRVLQGASDRGFAIPMSGFLALTFIAGWIFIAAGTMFGRSKDADRDWSAADIGREELSRRPELQGLPLQDLLSEEVNLCGYEGVFAAHDDGGFWGPELGARDYERVVFFPRVSAGPDRGSLVGPCVALAPDRFPARGEFVMTAVKSDGGDWEVLSLTPIQKGMPVTASTLRFDSTPEAKARAGNADAGKSRGTGEAR